MANKRRQALRYTDGGFVTLLVPVKTISILNLKMLAQRPSVFRQAKLNQIAGRKIIKIL
jgi:hypothetical protein